MRSKRGVRRRVVWERDEVVSDGTDGVGGGLEQVEDVDGCGRAVVGPESVNGGEVVDEVGEERFGVGFVGFWEVLERWTDRRREGRGRWETKFRELGIRDGELVDATDGRHQGFGRFGERSGRENDALAGQEDREREHGTVSLQRYRSW